MSLFQILTFVRIFTRGLCVAIVSLSLYFELNIEQGEIHKASLIK